MLCFYGTISVILLEKLTPNSEITFECFICVKALEQSCLTQKKKEFSCNFYPILTKLGGQKKKSIGNTLYQAIHQIKGRFDTYLDT